MAVKSDVSRPQRATSGCSCTSMRIYELFEKIVQQDVFTMSLETLRDDDDNDVDDDDDAMTTLVNVVATM